MKLFGLEITRNKKEKRGLNVYDVSRGTANYLSSLFGYSISVTTTSSLTDSAVYACVNRIASTLATLPVLILDEVNGSKTLNTKHPAYSLFSVKPNSYQTPYSFMELWIAQGVLYGRSGAVINRNASGRPISLEVIPGFLDCVLVDGVVMYQSESGTKYTVDEVLIAENFLGKSPIQLHADSIGLSLGALKYGSEYFKKGGGDKGVLMTENAITEEQFNRLKSDWNNSSSNTKILERGFQYKRLTITPEESQFLSTRKFQVEDIARIFGVPEMLIGGDSNTTYNNTESLYTIYTQTTILPWAERIEQEINKKLLTASERKTSKSELDLNKLLKTDVRTRTERIDTLVKNGTISINEARKAEGLNPIEDGDKHLVQVNQIPLADIDDYAASITNNGTNGE